MRVVTPVPLPFVCAEVFSSKRFLRSRTLGWPTFPAAGLGFAFPPSLSTGADAERMADLRLLVPDPDPNAAPGRPGRDAKGIAGCFGVVPFPFDRSEEGAFWP